MQASSSNTGKKAELPLSLAALGIVFGDIGTSPLYAFRESFLGGPILLANAAHVLGVLSMIVWSLTIVICIKYLFVVMRADNQGDGGIVALVSLLQRDGKRGLRGKGILVVMGLFGAALLYGDGSITPAISVLSALEGLQVAAPALKPYVVPLTLIVLVGLFAFQSRGTETIGRLFGPVMLLWFLVIAILGIVNIVSAPEVLRAIDPIWAIRFFAESPEIAFLVLGAVFLVVTGGEALYADMGHFGLRPIRLAWFSVVLPGLLLNYFGQGALVLSDKREIEHPFFHLAPEWALYPLVILATLATVIASQAVISGVFSLTRQAINLGQLPMLRIVQTSERAYGQIYIPTINWLLLATTLLLVVSFRSSDALASAYGVAISTDMLITTILIAVLGFKWKWPRWACVGILVFFLPVDLAFFASNLIKIPAGGWYPLAAGFAVYSIMLIWSSGRKSETEETLPKRPKFDDLYKILSTPDVVRPKGAAVFLAQHDDSRAPAALAMMLERLHAVPQTIVILTVEILDQPRVPEAERVIVNRRYPDVWFVHTRYGFSENVHLHRALSQACRDGLPTVLEEVTYLVTRDVIVPKRRRMLVSVWRDAIFRFLSRNTDQNFSNLGIPAGQTIEIGIHVRP